MPIKPEAESSMSRIVGSPVKGVKKKLPYFISIFSKLHLLDPGDIGTLKPIM